MSIIDDALTEHTEGLMQKAQAAQAQYETSKAQYASQHELIKSETERLEQSKLENGKLLTQLQEQRNDIETQQMALNAKAEELKKVEKDNEATAQVLIQRETAVKAAEDKLAQDRNLLESDKAEYLTKVAGVAKERQEVEQARQAHADEVSTITQGKAELEEGQAKLKAYAIELTQREDALKAGQAELEQKTADLSKQESLHADMGKMFAEKKDSLLAIEKSLLDRTKDLDDREAGIKAQETALAQREAKLKAKEKTE